MPYLCGLVMFVTHVMLGGALTVSKVFSTLSLLQIVRLGIGNFFPIAVQFLSEAHASCNRIQVGSLKLLAK